MVDFHGQRTLDIRFICESNDEILLSLVENVCSMFSVLYPIVHLPFVLNDDDFGERVFLRLYLNEMSLQNN